MFVLDWVLLLFSALSAVALVGLSIPLARALGIVDNPGEIKIHSLPTPRFGGIGIVAAVVIWGLYSGSLSGWALLGLLIIAATGALDDRYNLSPKVRLGAELIAGLALGLHFWSGLGWLGLVMGIVLVPVMANAVNLIDGMNGLASGNAMISAAGLAIMLWSLELEAMLAIIVVGSLVGFLVWNYPKAKTFMGDCGSLSTGYMLAMLLMFSATHGWITFLAAGVMVSFPLYDMVAGIIRRWRRGKPIFDGDRDHTYDRLDQLYVRNPTKTVLLVWAITGILVKVGLIVSNAALLVGTALIFLLVAFLFWSAYRLGAL
jgi:UDP-GlcNAc:undecaprenyl-phosphate GlcNAc-1-phosphate transferase